jgi:hypothetical protein
MEYSGVLDIFRGVLRRNRISPARLEFFEFLKKYLGTENFTCCDLIGRHRFDL